VVENGLNFPEYAKRWSFNVGNRRYGLWKLGPDSNRIWIQGLATLGTPKDV